MYSMAWLINDKQHNKHAGLPQETQREFVCAHLTFPLIQNSENGLVLKLHFPGGEAGRLMPATLEP